ncbi:MAG: hypothetical protein GTN40_01985 [Candidatus Aenigmarchaeota archaeon]|nr:hypothetical protein [Candidatus Aenigmarchaeota archaeon]
MKLSIIDIGSKSIKHYIFEVRKTAKDLIYYKRYSEAGLGETKSDYLDESVVKRNLEILGKCRRLNGDKKVLKCKIFGTDILRKAKNSSDFTDRVKNLFNSTIEVLSHQKEAQYLYMGFIDLIPEKSTFCAVNTGGGTTEIVIGNKFSLIKSYELPFGVNFLRETFLGPQKDWDNLVKYLNRNITLSKSKFNVKYFFITGILDFIIAVGPKLEFDFKNNTIPRHPIKLNINIYQKLVDLLKKTPIKQLKKLYEKDPGFAENVAIGQTIYLTVAKKIGAKEIIPSNNDLTDGVIYELSHL